MLKVIFMRQDLRILAAIACIRFILENHSMLADT